MKMPNIRTIAVLFGLWCVLSIILCVLRPDLIKDEYEGLYCHDLLRGGRGAPKTSISEPMLPASTPNPSPPRPTSIPHIYRSPSIYENLTPIVDYPVDYRQKSIDVSGFERYWRYYNPAPPFTRDTSHYDNPNLDADTLAYLYMTDPMFSNYRELYGYALADAYKMLTAWQNAYQRGAVATPPPSSYWRDLATTPSPYLVGALPLFIAAMYDNAKMEMYFWRANPHLSRFEVFLWHDLFTLPAQVGWYADQQRPIPLP